MPWKVDQELCTGCELCCDTAPDVFKMNESTNTAIVIDKNAPKDRADCVDAKDSCPVEAINWGD